MVIGANVFHEYVKTYDNKELQVNGTHFVSKAIQKQPALALFIIVSTLSHMVCNVLSLNSIKCFVVTVLSPHL